MDKPLRNPSFAGSFQIYLGDPPCRPAQLVGTKSALQAAPEALRFGLAYSNFRGYRVAFTGNTCAVPNQ